MHLAALTLMSGEIVLALILLRFCVWESAAWEAVLIIVLMEGYVGIIGRSRESRKGGGAIGHVILPDEARVLIHPYPYINHFGSLDQLECNPCGTCRWFRMGNHYNYPCIQRGDRPKTQHQHSQLQAHLYKEGAPLYPQ